MHCLDRTKKNTPVAGINSMHPRHAVYTCPLKGLQFAGRPMDENQSISAIGRKKGLINSEINESNDVYAFVRTQCWLYHPSVIKLLL